MVDGQPRIRDGRKLSCCQDILRFRRRNSRCTANFFAVHAVAGHEARGGGSFRVNSICCCTERSGFFAPPRDLQLSAKVQQEYLVRMFQSCVGA